MIPAPIFTLIGCGARKLPHPAPARDLYTGSLFRAARGYAEATGRPWAILSARHGLVQPDQPLDPYDWRLQVRDSDRPQTEELDLLTLGRQLQGWLPNGASLIEVHAGAPYVRWVVRAVAWASLQVDIQAPLAGLQVGQRLSWYKQRRTA